jgi:hypothetical protein
MIKALIERILALLKVGHLVQLAQLLPLKFLGVID